MIARASQLFLPTLRDDPADAEAASHRLLVRGGFIRQVSTGIWTLMPLGWRVHRKIEQIIREEMDAIGAQEMLMPLLTPAELWEATGRITIPEIFHLQDRTGRKFILPFTHEETVTFHARGAGRAGVSRSAARAGRDRDPRGDDDRRPGRPAVDRRSRDLEGDARGEGGRNDRACARPRRRPTQRDEAVRRAARLVASCD